MKEASRLGWPVILGLGVAPLALAVQGFFVSCVVLVPGLGGIHHTVTSSTTIDSRLAWGIWILYTFPPSLAQALVFTPLACLRLVSIHPEKRRLPLWSLGLSVITLGLCGLIIAWV